MLLIINLKEKFPQKLLLAHRASEGKIPLPWPQNSLAPGYRTWTSLYPVIPEISLQICFVKIKTSTCLWSPGLHNIFPSWFNCGNLSMFVWLSLPCKQLHLFYHLLLHVKDRSHKLDLVYNMWLHRLVGIPLVGIPLVLVGIPLVLVGIPLVLVGIPLVLA